MADMYVDILENMKQKSTDLENVNKVARAASMYADRPNDPATMKVLRNIATKKLPTDTMTMLDEMKAFENLESLRPALENERLNLTKMLEGKAGEAMIIDSSKKEDEE